MVRTRFYVVLKTNLLPVTTSDNARISDVFEDLKIGSDVARRILGVTSYDQYQYYRLKNPVPLPRRPNHPAIIQTCMNRTNWEEVFDTDAVDVLSSTLATTHVYMVIQSREGETERAITHLHMNYADIFSRLQITVSNLQRWTMDDVSNNMRGGRFWRPEDDEDFPPVITAIEQSLDRRRTYIIPAGGLEIRDYENARHYNTHFDDVFVATTNPPSNVTNREFATFFNVLRCFDEESDRIKNDSSSVLKASNFIVYFILPPFFSSHNAHFEFKQEKPWGFPIFISTQDQPDTWCQFRPRSDFIVSSPSFLCPFLISEVVSQDNEENRYRMLLQAIAVARAGQYLMQQGADMKFFVVAIYLRANLTAERYIVTHIGPDKETGTHRPKEFRPYHGRWCGRICSEMYNFLGKVEDLAEHLDEDKDGMLNEVKNAASKVITFTSKAREKRSTPSTLTSIPEGGENDEAQDDLGVFGADDIQAILKRMNYKINFILFGYPYVAAVLNVTQESEKRYLKFVKEGQKEVEVLRYLTGIDSPANHTIPVRIWPVRGGNVVSMPVAGGWLTSLTTPDAHLWSVAKQLFEAVDFMHQYGVVHMDLKPQNILIPLDGGRLSIIDFNRSLRVKGIGHKIRGIVGTVGYIAPDVSAGDGLYSAIRADLWSCGKTLEELCRLCHPSMDRDTLLEISRQLMDENPEKRPMMSDVLDRLAHRTIDAITGQDFLSHSVVPPAVNA